LPKITMWRTGSDSDGNADRGRIGHSGVGVTGSTERSAAITANGVYGGSARTGLALKLAVWGGCLAGALVLSVCLKERGAAPNATARIAFHAAMAGAYLVVFCHCLMRLVYSRWASWLLFTAGFAALSSSSSLGVAVSAGLVRGRFLHEHFDLLRSAMLPAAATLLLSAAYASRARIRGRGAGSWKIYAWTVLIGAAFAAAWRLGMLAALGEMLRAARIDPWLAIDTVSAAALIALLQRTLRLAASNHDEIVVPMCYWVVATLLGTVLALASWREPHALWWEISGLELAGIAALLVGLSIENEKAHRRAAEQMADLRAMQSISWSLVGAATLTELCQALTNAVSEGLGVSLAAVYVPGDESDQLVITATAGTDDPSVAVGKACSLQPERRPGFHGGHTARAFRTGTVQVLREIFSDVEFMPWRTVAREEGTVLSVPLPYQGRVTGVMNLFLSGVTSVPESRLRLFESIAAAVSPAIENARLRPSPTLDLDMAA